MSNNVPVKLDLTGRNVKINGPQRGTFVMKAGLLANIYTGDLLSSKYECKHFTVMFVFNLLSCYQLFYARFVTHLKWNWLSN